MVYCTASQRLRLPHASSTKSRVVSPTWPSLYREPLRPLGVLPRRGSCSHNLGQRYPALLATPGSCARPHPSHVLRTMAWSASLCRLPRAPAGRRPFPMLSPQSLWRCLDPYPAAPLRCAYPFLPAELRPHLTCNRFGARHYRHDSNCHDEPISGLQSFLDVQAPPLARPPDCSYRRSSKSSGQPGRVRHAKNVWLPNTNCGIATCLNRAIGTTGLSPARLRPSRPLHTRHGLASPTKKGFGQ